MVDKRYICNIIDRSIGVVVGRKHKCRDKGQIYILEKGEESI